MGKPLSPHARNPGSILLGGYITRSTNLLALLGLHSSEVSKWVIPGNTEANKSGHRR